MKRVHLQKEKPAPHSYQEVVDSPLSQSDSAPQGAKRRARTSAAMIGLALSMGATSLLLPRQDDGAVAAEPKVPDTAISATLIPNLDSQSEVQPSETAQFPVVRLVEHVVQDGQTLQQLASQYQVSVQSIALVNGLTLDSALRAGQTLKIPASHSLSTATQTPASSLVASAALNQLPTVSSNQRLEESQTELQRTDRNNALDRLRQQREKLRDSLAELRREEPVVAANQDAAKSTVDSSVQSVEQSDVSQSQAAIASTLAALPSLPPAENSSPEAVQEPARPTSAEPVAMRTSPTVSTSGMQTYRVSPGDTLARIARSYNIPQSMLIDANRISDPNVIFVGQVLTVPVVQSTTPQPPVTVASEQLSAGVLPAAAPSGTGSSSSGSIQPAVAPAAPTVVAQAAQTDSTAISRTASPSEVAPSINGQIAVAPLSEGATRSVPSIPGVDGSSGTVDSDLSSRFNPYVAGLLSELRELRHRDQSQATAAVPSATTVAPAVAIAPAIASPGAAGDLAIAPHFNESISRNADTLPVSSPAQISAPSASQPGLVAAAPLGSESYDPLLQPVTGRLVSPDLPPLPGADSFLPEDGLFNGYIWPASGMLTSGYGWRWGRMHQGIDIAADVGTPIHAAASGTVEFAGWNSGGYGNMVEIRHPDGSMTRYAHMNAIHVEVGQRVSQGDQLGEMGSTGYSTGPHLHFEVHLPDQGTVNPIAYLPADQTAQR